MAFASIANTGTQLNDDNPAYFFSDNRFNTRVTLFTTSLFILFAALFALFLEELAIYELNELHAALKRRQSKKQPGFFLISQS